MKKEVIYIDVEDDLTTIIEKIKHADASIVALVPPRRLGVLQSVVNLKLLKRAADEADKKAVLITSDHALMSLTAGLGLPVARNLQSRPELIPEMLTDDDDAEIIQGETSEQIARTASKDIADESAAQKTSSKPKTKIKPMPAHPDKKFKVPNFDNFRKKLVFIGLGAALLVAFLVWAIGFAPRGTIVVRAQTEKITDKMVINVDSDAAKTDAEGGIIKGELRQDSRNLTQTFTPSGRKDVGEKAAGTITIRNCDYADGFTLQAGAQFVSESGQTFISTKTVTVPKFTGSASSCSTSGGSAGKAAVAVNASTIGEDYNIAAQEYSLPGITGKVDAIGSAMEGGSKKTVTVVTQADVDRVKGDLLAQDTKPVKDALVGQFGGSTRALEGTFDIKQGNVAVQPAVDQEATQATVTIPMTYTVLGLKNDDISKVLSAFFGAKVDNKDQQQVYDNGYRNLKLTIDNKPSPQKAEIQIEADGHIGPKINTDALAKQVTGKRHGEIEALVKQLPGVQDVESHFSPFWVNKAPKVERLTIKLEVANEQ